MASLSVGTNMGIFTLETPDGRPIILEVRRQHGLIEFWAADRRVGAISETDLASLRRGPVGGYVMDGPLLLQKGATDIYPRYIWDFQPWSVVAPYLGYRG